MWTVLAALAAFVGFAVAIAVAGPPLSGLLRVAFDVLGVATVGLAVLDLLAARSREGSQARLRVWRPMAVSAGAWVMAALGLSVALTADSAGVPLTRVSTAQWTGFLTSVSSGRMLCLSMVCAAGCTVLAGYRARRYAGGPAAGRAGPTRSAADDPRSALPVLAPALAAMAALPMAGHLAQVQLGSLVVLAHVLAAAVWCGAPVAMVLVLRTRREWARILPRFSAVAFAAVWVVLASGVVGALIQPDGALRHDGSAPADIASALIDTGYGRILLLKTALLAVLLIAGSWYRTRWVPQAEVHRVDAELSLQRAGTECAVMAVVVGLAAGLATVG